jgi:cold shock CspA family protein
MKKTNSKRYPSVVALFLNNTHSTAFGKVRRVEATHGFITIDGRSDDIFFHKNQIELDILNQLIFGKRVQYQIGFSLNGPTAINITITVAS